MTDLILPAGKALGCKPRSPRLMDAFPRAADVIPLIPEDQWPEYMARNTIKQAVWNIFDQDGVGSCAAEAATLAEMICREVANLDRVLLNPWSLYRQVNGGSDNGSGIDENLEAVMRTGILPESYWPRSKGWRSTPPVGWQTEAAKFRGLEAFDVQTKAEFGSCICAGLPVVVGVNWDGGGHAICFDEAMPNDAEFANSWSPTWNGNGFGRMGWGQIMRGVETFGAWALRVATYS